MTISNIRFLGYVVLGAVLLPILVGCRRASVADDEAPRPVVVMQLAQGDPATPLTLTGTVEPWAEEDVAFEVSGRLTYIVEPGTFLDGRWVENGKVEIEGDILATMDKEPYAVALTAAESNVEMSRVNLESVLPAKLAESQARQLQADKEHERNVRIREQSPGALSERQLIESQANRDAARAAVKQAEAGLNAGAAELNNARAKMNQAHLDLDRTRLYAPFRGEVTDVFVQAGGYAEAGKPVAHLVTMDPIKVRVSVSSDTNRHISRGDPVLLSLPEGGKVTASVYQKSTVADPATRTFSVTLICRNQKSLSSDIEPTSVEGLPRVTDLLPATRLDVGGGGPLYVEERKCLHEDAQGYFVWAAEGVNLQDAGHSANGVFTIRKIRVVPGAARVNYQGIFLARELSDSGPLQPGQACVVGVPPDAKDADRVALLPESWMLQPGSLVEAQFPRDQGVPGFYVPMHAIVPNGSGEGFVFVVRNDVTQEDQALAEKISVTLHETVGELQRIDAADIDVGTLVIVRGASYLRDQEPVSVVRIDKEAS